MRYFKAGLLLVVSVIASFVATYALNQIHEWYAMAVFMWGILVAGFAGVGSLYVFSNKTP